MGRLSQQVETMLDKMDEQDDKLEEILRLQRQALERKPLAVSPILGRVIQNIWLIAVAVALAVAQVPVPEAIKMAFKLASGP